MKTKWVLVVFLISNFVQLLAQERTFLSEKEHVEEEQIAIIKTESLPLNYGWRWLSFPRMERYGNLPFSSESVLDNLNVYPAKEFTLYKGLYPENSDHKKWELLPTPPHWDGDLEDLYSTSGYKLYIGQSSGLQPEIKLYGAKLHPEKEMTLPGGGQKIDIGYFIEESQYPWDAFPADLYNSKLMLIQAQYWTMVKDETKGSWKMTGKITPIKYGDMVIVKTNSQGPIQFSWNDPGDSEENVEIPEPQNYTWEEKAEYTPFFIETDSVSDITEIAVMVDGVCLGATVRQPGDTLVEVDGYFEGLPLGAVVEFETWNGYKSAPV